jgi:hypothetical protein
VVRYNFVESRLWPKVLRFLPRVRGNDKIVFWVDIQDEIVGEPFGGSCCGPQQLAGFLAFWGFFSGYGRWHKACLMYEQ